jgi:hypothetical protein
VSTAKIEAIVFKKVGISHRVSDDEWWTWDPKYSRAEEEWTSHPDPDGCWARYVAARMLDKITVYDNMRLP